MAEIGSIIKAIDAFLEEKKLDKISAVVAASMLQKKRILQDSISQPGMPLRKILRAGRMSHAYQVGTSWFIPHSNSRVKSNKNEPNRNTIIDSKNTSQKKSKKNSFEYLSNPDAEILILGSMPEELSLKKGEYYAHSRTRFWSIISIISKIDLESNYSDKCAMLSTLKIALWDVVHLADRIGSLERAIINEIPNDLDSFIENHKHLKVIAFNGKKAETLFDRYFDRKSGIEYYSLPSTSPTNASIDFSEICESWSVILK